MSKAFRSPCTNDDSKESMNAYEKTSIGPAMPPNI
jgi:hypothetical protein